MNYYMAFGGTTFGRQVGGPLIITSYDYDVQINEYGLRSEPKFSLTSKLHEILMNAADIILSVESLPLPKAVPLEGSNSCESHTYTCADCDYGSKSKSKSESGSCIVFLSNYGVSSECNFLSNSNANTEPESESESESFYTVPAWSVSILRGEYTQGQCTNTMELLNTKTSTVSDVDIKVANYQAPQVVDSVEFSYKKGLKDPTPYEMSRKDPRKQTISPSPVEQLTLTDDKTDYLWYSVQIPVDELKQGNSGSISFVTGIAGGSIGYIYANGIYIGSTLTKNGHSPVLSMLPIENMTTIEATVTSTIDVELPQSCRHKCQIDILSMNMGIKNYGPYLELVKTGIISDISWKSGDSDSNSGIILSPVTHTVGLLGESVDYVGDSSHSTGSDSSTNDIDHDKLVENVPLQWYTMTFPSPVLSNQSNAQSQSNYALELASTGSTGSGSDSHIMGKGGVWVNGMMLGRYWNVIGSTSITDCDESCLSDQIHWVGAYSPERCTTGCTIPSQTQYKVPYSLLHSDGKDNILILFEEIGGFPTNIKLNEIVMKEL